MRRSSWCQLQHRQREIDGENGFGFVIGMRAMAEAIAMAREFGIGVVSARRSTHFGMAASYALPAVEAVVRLGDDSRA